MSVVYEVKCTCGKELEQNRVWLGPDLDLLVEVLPCNNCLAEAEREGMELEAKART